MKQLGGLKLKHVRKQGFQAVSDMLINSTSKLRILTHSSRKGFLFVLDVPMEHSEYIALHKGKFTKPVTSFILKVAVIKKDNGTYLDAFKGVVKLSESENSYFEEAKLQQNIWIRSIEGGRPAICPSIANFSLFDRTNSINLIWFFKSKVEPGIGLDVVYYLLSQLKYDHQTTDQATIGIIVMPNITNSITLDQFWNTNRSDETAATATAAAADLVGLKHKYKDELDHVLAQLSAQVVRLFIDIGVVHLDLHTNNVLVDNTTLNTLIIDFGSASDITNNEEDLLTIPEKVPLNDKKTEFFEKLFDRGKRQDLKKIEKKKFIFMIEVLNFIKSVDQTYNQTHFVNSNPSSYQMSWYEYYLANMYVYGRSYEFLIQMYQQGIERSNLLPVTLEGLRNDGFLIDLSSIQKFKNGQFQVSGAAVPAYMHIPAYVQTVPAAVPAAVPASMPAYVQTRSRPVSIPAYVETRSRPASMPVYEHAEQASMPAYVQTRSRPASIPASIPVYEHAEQASIPVYEHAEQASMPVSKRPWNAAEENAAKRSRGGYLIRNRKKKTKRRKRRTLNIK